MFGLTNISTLHQAFSSSSSYNIMCSYHRDHAPNLESYVISKQQPKGIPKGITAIIAELANII